MHRVQPVQESNIDWKKVWMGEMVKTEIDSHRIVGIHEESPHCTPEEPLDLSSVITLTHTLKAVSGD